MSSSSSPDQGGSGIGPATVVYAETVAELLRRAVEIVAVECPPGFERFVLSGERIAVAVTVDDERFVVDFDDPSGIEIDAADDADAHPSDERNVASVRIESSRAAIVDVLSGRLALVEAVSSDRLVVVGSLHHISRLHDALIGFMQAAVRCPSMPDVLARLSGTLDHDVT